MRFTARLAAVAAVALLSIACTGESDGPPPATAPTTDVAARSSPTAAAPATDLDAPNSGVASYAEPTATPVPLDVARSGGPPELPGSVAPDGLELLAESDVAMRSLTALSIVEEYRTTRPTGIYQVQQQTLALVEPRRLRVVDYTEDGIPGDDESRYDKPPRSPHEYFDRAEGYSAFDGVPADAPRVSDVRIVGEDEIDGEPVWVVWYQFRVVGFDSVYQIFRTEWISKESKLLLRQVQLDTDPSSGTERENILSDFEF